MLFKISDRTSRRNVGSVPSTGYSTPSSILEPLGLALEGTDPLTQFAKEELDPLSQMALDAVCLLAFTILLFVNILG